MRSYLVNPEGELISRSASHLDAFSGYPERTVATERCPWQDNSYTIGPLTPVLSYWGQLLSTHLRAHWIETDSLLQGQLVSCSRWLPASPQGSDHIFSLKKRVRRMACEDSDRIRDQSFLLIVRTSRIFTAHRSSGGSNGVPSI